MLAFANSMSLRTGMKEGILLSYGFCNKGIVEIVFDNASVPLSVLILSELFTLD